MEFRCLAESMRGPDRGAGYDSGCRAIGSPVDERFCEVYRIENSKIVARQSYLLSARDLDLGQPLYR